MNIYYGYKMEGGGVICVIYLVSTKKIYLMNHIIDTLYSMCVRDMYINVNNK